MLKRVGLIVVIIALMLFLVGSVSATADIDSEIFDVLEDEGEVKIVIVLKDDVDTNSEDLKERKEAIGEIQEDFIDEIGNEGVETQVPEDKIVVESGMGVLSDEEIVGEIEEDELIDVEEALEEQDSETDLEITYQYETINAVAAVVTDESVIDEILESDLVEAVYLDYLVSIDLDASIPQINADDVWDYQINGINITGAGETVCVIDTGIDYGHDSLGNCSPVSYSLNGDIENLSSVVESAHDYANSYEYTWKINQTGYGNIAVHFVNISLEDVEDACVGCDTTDRVYVLDGDNQTLAVYRGDLTNVWSPYSTGDTIYVKLVTDGSYTDYGFYIDQVINGTTNTTMNWSSCNKVIGGYDVYNNDYNPIDDHNHGTHVAGIIASTHGTYRGVAPDANLVAIKALSASGGGYSSDIAAGIDWCTTNADRLNISVISMSLGCDGAGCTHYQTYCNSDITASAINAAYAQNILVAIASGNLGWTDGISSPSCVQNATPVGAVNGADAMVYNRGNLLDFVVPGTSIYSTIRNDGWGSMSGTSMSTPHFSGAVVLLRQYWRLAYNQTPTIAQIENKFDVTGVNIDDEANPGNNYSRIDILAAIQPYINFTSNSQSNGGSISYGNDILINVSSDVNLSTALLEWDYNNGTITNITMNQTNVTNFFYTMSGLEIEDYSYQVFGNDTAGTFGTSATRTVSIVTGINISVFTPVADSYHNSAFYLNSTIDDNNISYSYYNITNSSSVIIQSNSNSSIFQTSFDWYELVNISNSSFGDGNYTLSLYANDTTGDQATGSVNFVVDKTIPTIVVDSVTPATVYNNDTVVFRINVTDSNVNASNVLLSSNFSGSLTNYTMTSESSSVFNYSLSGTTNLTNQNNITYSFFATDLAGNSNQSGQFSFTVQNRNISLVNVVSPSNNSVLELGNSTLFNGTATDPDNDSLTYVWNISDGTDETDANFSKSFSSEGTIEINLTVSDPYGSSLSTSISVEVNDSTAPTIEDITYDSAVHISSDVNQTVSVDVSDLSNVSSIKLYYNESLVTASSSNATYATWTWENFSVGDDYNFTIGLIDDSSNNNAENTTYTFDVDSCSDSAMNGDETATDCGGSCSACDGGGGGSGGGSGGTNTISSTDDEEEETTETSELDSSNDGGSGSSSGDSDPIEDVSSTSGSNTGLEETEASTRGASVVSEVVNATGEEPIKLILDDPKISIDEIEIRTDFVGEVNITITSYDSLPTSLSLIEGAYVGLNSIKNVYQYFEIDSGNLSNDDIKKVKFTFSVERTWLNSMGYSEKKVKLNTYSNGEWKDLSTDLISSDSELITYQSDVDHLSYFAITAEPAKNIFNNLFGFTGLSAKHNLLIILIVLVLGLGTAYYFLRPKGG